MQDLAEYAHMRRPVPFIVIEAAVFAAAVGADVVTIAPIPVSQRLAVGLAIGIFVALGFIVPNGQTARTALLLLDAAFLALLSASTGLAAIVSILLPLRCLELRPNDRTALGASAAFALCAFGVSLFVGIRGEHRPAEELALPVLLPLYVLALGLAAVINDLRTSRAALAAANAELALRAERWEEVATLAERYRIGRDLEAEIGRGLQTVGEQLECALRVGGADPAAAKVFVFQAQRTAAFTLSALHRTVSTLRADSVAHGDLPTALRDLCKAFSTAGRLPISATISDVKMSDPLVTAAMERIAREALINVARHSEAQNVKLSFGVKDDRIELLLEDDGVGFDPAAVRSGKGLSVMRDRAALIGGACVVESSPSRGTRVRLTLPATPR